MLMFEAAFVVHPPLPDSCFYWCFHVHMEAEDTPTQTSKPLMEELLVIHVRLSP